MLYQHYCKFASVQILGSIFLILQKLHGALFKALSLIIMILFIELNIIIHYKDITEYSPCNQVC